MDLAATAADCTENYSVGEDGFLKVYFGLVFQKIKILGKVEQKLIILLQLFNKIVR
jgi:hypothetical protein